MNYEKIDFWSQFTIIEIDLILTLTTFCLFVFGLLYIINWHFTLDKRLNFGFHLAKKKKGHIQ